MRSRRYAAALVRASHPEPVAAVTAGVTAIGVAAGLSAQGAALVGAAVFTGQLSIGWSNDYLDRDRDRDAERADKPLVNSPLPARAVAVAAVLALVACVPLSLGTGWRAGAAHLGAVGSGWVYNLILKRVIWSVVAFIPGFGLFPAYITLSRPGHPWPAWWALTTAAFVGIGAHFANVVPDLEVDLVTGVRGLPQRIGATGSRIVAAVFLTAAAATAAFGPGRPGVIGLAGIAVIVLATGIGLAGGRGLGRYATMIVVITAALVSAVLLITQAGRIY